MIHTYLPSSKLHYNMCPIFCWIIYEKSTTNKSEELKSFRTGYTIKQNKISRDK